VHTVVNDFEDSSFQINLDDGVDCARAVELAMTLSTRIDERVRIVELGIFARSALPLMGTMADLIPREWGFMV
jgi:hypothetical protein